MHQYTVKILQFKNVHNLNWKSLQLHCREDNACDCKGTAQVWLPLVLLCGQDWTVDAHWGLLDTSSHPNNGWWWFNTVNTPLRIYLYTNENFLFNSQPRHNLGRLRFGSEELQHSSSKATLRWLRSCSPWPSPRLEFSETSWVKVSRELHPTPGPSGQTCGKWSH